MPDNLAIGAALSRGANAFYTNFTNTKLLKHKLKLEENAPVVAMLTRQLEDDTISYDEKANIMNQIQRLSGAKNIGQNLSDMFGMSKYRDKMVANPNEPAQQGQAGTPNKTMVDPNATNNSMGATDSITMQGTGATQDIPEGQIRQGELSPAEVKLGLVRKQQQFKDASDFKKEAAMLKLNYTLQKEILGKDGYTKELPPTFDDDGNLTLRFMRVSDGDILTRNIGKVSTQAMEIAKINASKPTGRMGQLQQAQNIIAEYEANNTSHTQADYKAAKETIEHFEKTGQLMDAQITALGQKVTGTTPPTIEQTKDDTISQQRLQLEAKKDFDIAHAEMTAAQTDRDEIGRQKEEAARATEEADKKFGQIKNEFSASDAEWKDAEKDANIKRARFNELDRRYHLANNNYMVSATKRTGAEQRMNTVGTNTSNTGSSGSVDPKIQPAIDFFRNKNKGTKYEKWTDQQIVDYLRSKGKLK